MAGGGNHKKKPAVQLQVHSYYVCTLAWVWVNEVCSHDAHRNPESHKIDSWARICNICKCTILVSPRIDLLFLGGDHLVRKVSDF